MRMVQMSPRSGGTPTRQSKRGRGSADVPPADGVSTGQGRAWWCWVMKGITTIVCYMISSFRFLSLACSSGAAEEGGAPPPSYDPLRCQ